MSGGTDGDVVIREATESDLGEVTRLYDTYIVDSPVSFDAEPWSAAKRAAWWEEHQSQDRLVVLVADAGDRLLGTAYSSWFRRKDAYRRTVETSIVLDPDHLGRGLGTRLYGELMDRLAAAGTHRAYAVITLPNDASVALHHRVGFVDNGIQHEVGWKLGRYWSTLTMEKRFG